MRLSKASTWRILPTDLDLHAYKVVLTRQFTVTDFVGNMLIELLKRLEDDSDFGQKIIFLDELVSRLMYTCWFQCPIIFFLCFSYSMNQYLLILCWENEYDKKIVISSNSHTQTSSNRRALLHSISLDTSVPTEKYSDGTFLHFRQ